MLSLDTNILVRFLLNDDQVQAKKVYDFLKEIELKKDQVFISTLVILELLWVLESAYKINRKEIINSLDQLTLMPIIKFENLKAIQAFIHDALNSNFDLSDLLIAHCSAQHNCSHVLTFDNKAAKHGSFKLLK